MVVYVIGGGCEIARLIRIAWNKNKLLHKYLMFLLITIQIIEVINCNILENYSNVYGLHINICVDFILY